MLTTLLLNSSQPIRPIFWCFTGLCAGIYLFFRGFRLLQQLHLILNTPASKIRSASLGMVELSGLAVGPYTVIAPVTARSCYFYRTIVWEWKRQGRSRQWVKVASECVHVPFFLDDNTGRVMVDPRGAELDLHRDFREQFCDSFFTMKEEAPGNVRNFLLHHGISTTNKIKVEEFCIKPKNSLFLLGTLEENSELEFTAQPIQDEEHNTLANVLWSNPFFSRLSGIRSEGNPLSWITGREAEHCSASELLIGDPDSSGASGGSYSGGHVLGTQSPVRSSAAVRLSPDSAATQAVEMTQHQKIASALMRAGITNPAAWAIAGVTPAGKARSSNSNGSSHETAPPDGFDSHPPVVMTKGKNSPTFLISWRSQREVARSLRWKCMLMIWGGPALFLLCLYALLSLAQAG